MRIRSIWASNPAFHLRRRRGCECLFWKGCVTAWLPEAAFIAGIIRSPNRYNPFKNPEKVTERRNQVLESMLRSREIISPQLSEQSYAIPVQLKEAATGRRDLQGMPYFSQYAIDELAVRVRDPEALQHLRVYTSIDPDLQGSPTRPSLTGSKSWISIFLKSQKAVLNASLVAIRPKTGEIVAMVGGRDYEENQFNRATDANGSRVRYSSRLFTRPLLIRPTIPDTRVFTAATIFKDEKKIFTFEHDTYSPEILATSFRIRK